MVDILGYVKYITKIKLNILLKLILPLLPQTGREQKHMTNSTIHHTAREKRHLDTGSWAPPLELPI